MKKVISLISPQEKLDTVIKAICQVLAKEGYEVKFAGEVSSLIVKATVSVLIEDSSTIKANIDSKTDKKALEGYITKPDEKGITPAKFLSDKVIHLIKSLE